MDFNKLTIKSQQAIQAAQQIALSHSHSEVNDTHLLQAMLQTDKKLIPHFLNKFGVNIPIFEQALQAMLKSYPKVSGDLQIQFSRSTIQLINKALNLALKMTDEYVSLEHLLLALLEGHSKASQLLKDNGLNKKDLQLIIKELRKGSQVNSSSAEDQYNALSKYAKNLNQLAQANKLDPVIGRDEEIRRVLQILTRRTKNNPILIGEPGVGKTAIAEGIAHRIINGDVPENLKTKVIFSLDMALLIAGAKFKGEFEERLKAIVKEITSAQGQIVLFIDEIHSLIGAGGGQGAMDAANILKPALARGELRAVGATTLDEYQKYFEKDKALERRFQKVIIDEPSTEDSISILRGIKEKYENHHKVQIKDAAIIAAVELSQRYISDRFLPDKAIDLIDEAASKIRMEINSKPEELDELDRKIMQLEIEREAIKREKDLKKLDYLSEEIANLTEKRNEFKAKWEDEKSIIDKIQQTKLNIEYAKSDAEKAEREGDFGKVAEIRYAKLKNFETSMAQYKEQLTSIQSETKMIKEEVDAEEIAAVVSRWTGIPVYKMLEGERAKLLKMEEHLAQRIVGQTEAIELIANAVRRSRSGLQDFNRPIGSFIFLGSTGVGKTELAKALSDILFDDENALTRIDMSEYQERHAISRLLGAPPGYVGYDEGGQLTEAVRRKPYSVVLLDEIEKAHPDVFNILLQVLDEGRLTDNKGRLVNFKNTIIIMTSNIGSEIIQSNFEKLNKNNAETLVAQTKIELLEYLKKSVRLEFLNRIDDIVMFKPLSEKDILDILNIQMKNLQKKLLKNNIQIELSPEAAKELAFLAYEPEFGARPIKRIIQNQILNQLSKEILAGNISTDDHIVIDSFHSQIVFRKK